MAETIEVRYKELFFDGSRIYHKYIIYTNNAGIEFYGRGGPANGSELGSSGEGGSSGGGAIPFGDIVTNYGAYLPDTLDWDYTPNDPDPREVRATGDDLSAQWNIITQTLDAINNGHIAYLGITRNSNSTVDECLETANLPQPTQDDLFEHFSPGSGNNLGGPDVPGGIWCPLPDLSSYICTDLGGGRYSETITNADGSYKVSTYENGQLVTEEGADSDCIGYTKAYNPDGTLATMTQTSGGNSLLQTTMDAFGNVITFLADIPSLIGDGLSLIYDTINFIPTFIEDIGTAVWNTITDVGNSIGNLFVLNTNPIGAFYEATTPTNDNAASIADLTGRIMLNNEAISKDELEALDTNGDGKITSADTNFSALTVWQDINEDGRIDAGESKTLTQADITSIKSEDYKYFTSGNGEDKADLIAQPDKITPSSTEPTIDFNHYRNEVDLSYSFGMVAVYTNHIADSQGYYTCTSYQ